MPQSLSNEHRAKLDGIVSRMEAAGEPEDAIRFVVSDFKSKYTAPDQAAPAEPQGDLGRFAGYKRLGDAVVSGVKSAYHHPIESLGALGATAAIAATAPVSVPAALAAAGLGGAGGAAIGMMHNAAQERPPEASPTTAAGVAGEMGKQGALNAAFEGAGALGRGGMSLAKNLYLRSLKPTKSVLEAAPAFRTGGQDAARTELAQTGLTERAPIGSRGITKIKGRIDDVNQQIANRVAEGDLAGRSVNPMAVAGQAAGTKAQFEQQVAPQADLQAVSRVLTDFLEHPNFGPKNPFNPAQPPRNLSLSEAQAMKQGTYRTLKGKSYGELKSADTETQKALARGLKQEIATAAPEVGPLNLTESKLISLKKALQDRGRTAGNADPLKLGEQVLMASNPKSAILGLINRPGILSRGAIGLNEASKVINKLPTANSMRAALIAALSGQEE
jgi:hypothetical protein